jgi:hypothetical protein
MPWTINLKGRLIVQMRRLIVHPLKHYNARALLP